MDGHEVYVLSVLKNSGSMSSLSLYQSVGNEEYTVCFVGMLCSDFWLALLFQINEGSERNCYCC